MSGGDALVPRTQSELVAIVAAAYRERVPVFVTSGAARPSHAPDSARVVSTRGLDRVVAHESGDLTLTAECGVTVKAAQELLAGHRQFLAFDDVAPTIGSVIASGREGDSAARFGLVRDQVLGLTVVNGDGRVTHCGGRVVKNVTGYDLCRLYTGSRGGLGIILEATLRLRPTPERWSRLRFDLPDAATAFERALEVRRRIPEIAQVTVDAGSGARVGVETCAAGSPALIEALDREVGDVMRGLPAGPGTKATTSDAATIVEIATLPTRLHELHSEVAPLLSPSASVRYDVLRGVRRSLHAPAAPPFPDPARLDALLTRLRATLDCPTDPAFRGMLAARLPGQVPGGLEIMKSLKAALDPAGILNPGMNVWG